MSMEYFPVKVFTFPGDVSIRKFLWEPIFPVYIHIDKLSILVFFRLYLCLPVQ